MPRLNELLQATNGASQAGHTDTPPPAEDEVDQDACPRCGGAGYLRRDVPLGDPEFGKAVPCPCTQLEGRDVRQARLERYSNLGPLTRLTFENLVRSGRSPNPRHRTIFQRCAEDAEEFANDPRGWIVLVGPSGSGKTHIAAAIANRCIERGTPAFFVVVPDLLDHLRAAYKPDSDLTYDQLFEQVRNAPVLVLDDLGTQSATSWAQEKLFQIINHRFNARLPTVVTSNLELSKMDDRLRTRLGDPSQARPHADPIARVYVLEEHGPLDDWEFNMMSLPKTRDMTFFNFDHTDVLSARDKEWRERAYHVALEYAEKPSGWLVLLSGRATDRTHLMAAIANKRRDVGESPLLVRVRDLLDFLRHSMSGEGNNDYYSRKQAMRAYPFLLLDELEIGAGSEYSRNELYDLLYWRQLARLPTVVSSPNENNQLLSDPGWRRLARLLMVPDYCTEVLVGEAPPEEQGPPASRSTRQTSRRKPG